MIKVEKPDLTRELPDNNYRLYQKKHLHYGHYKLILLIVLCVLNEFDHLVKHSIINLLILNE